MKSAQWIPQVVVFVLHLAVLKNPDLFEWYYLFNHMIAAVFTVLTLQASYVDEYKEWIWSFSCIAVIYNPIILHYFGIVAWPVIILVTLLIAVHAKVKKKGTW